MLFPSVALGWWAVMATGRKLVTYSCPALSHNIVPMALVTLGAIGPISLAFLKDLRTRLWQQTGEEKLATIYLLQQLSLSGSTARKIHLDQGKDRGAFDTEPHVTAYITCKCCFVILLSLLMDVKFWKMSSVSKVWLCLACLVLLFVATFCSSLFCSAYFTKWCWKKIENRKRMKLKCYLAVCWPVKQQAATPFTPKSKFKNENVPISNVQYVAF